MRIFNSPGLMSSFTPLGLDHTPARLAIAEAGIQEASRLRPDDGETHLCAGRELYWGHRDYDGALDELEIAGQKLPNNPGVFELKVPSKGVRGAGKSLPETWSGHLNSTRATLTRSTSSVVSYAGFRRYAEQKSTLDRGIGIEPNNPGLKLSAHSWNWIQRPMPDRCIK